MAGENKDFRLKAVAELLDGKHHFVIPSYQRGYRWDGKQVKDLLGDIWDFARNAQKGDFYCLQPIVVRPDHEGEDNTRWLVIDGQQRLTTMLILLNYLKKLNPELPGNNYTIRYATRPDLNFEAIDQWADVDSYYAANTLTVIKQWFKDNTVRKSKIEDVLFLNYGESNSNLSDAEPQVKFIWYVSTASEGGGDIEAIRIFNNLNRGKIRLTNAELIKALFVLKCDPKRQTDGKMTSTLSLSEFAYQWDEIENELHNSRFWLFLANNGYKPSSRIDIIFDFLTGKTTRHDDDYSYRRFQELFDGVQTEFWHRKKIENFLQAWQRVLEVFYTFRYWFEQPDLYHYIGYLISIGVSMQTIYPHLENQPKREVVSRLRKLVKTELRFKKAEDIDSVTYHDRDACRNVLLLFNVLTHLDSSYPFPFDRYKKESWDIEHIDSQTTNPLTSISEKVNWLKYIEHISYNDTRWPKLQQEAQVLIAELETKNKDGGEGFKGLYEKILSVAQQNGTGEADDENKDSIENLALLDARTNRSYGNALFQTKRQKIIEADTQGKFVPICTKNLFLKYYSPRDNDSSQWDNRWNNADKKNYLNAIHAKIDSILD